MIPIPIIILGIVFALIATRRIGHIKIQMWQSMMVGAIAVLMTGQIHPIDALKSINLDVMLFLFGMFVVGSALEESGYLAHLAYRFFRKARSVDHLVLLLLFGFGAMSAFLMNDTVAIVGVPVVLLLARHHCIPPKLLLLTLAFAVTIGSTMSPIGNPQNLLVAVNGNISNPFVTFFQYLLLPTLINLLLAYLLLKLFYQKHFHKTPLAHSQEPIRDKKLAWLCRVSLVLLITLVVAKIAMAALGIQVDFKLVYIALISALPILILSSRRLEVIKKVDWHTLVFFAAMFVLMESVWRSGFFQSLITGAGIEITSVPMVLAVSVLLSQLISNVPLVALYLPMLVRAGATTSALMALAAGSTIAGNLTILGAASNVIIIQGAEKRSGDTLTFLEFLKIGAPLTLLNIIIYWAFFCIF